MLHISLQCLGLATWLGISHPLIFVVGGSNRHRVSWRATDTVRVLVSLSPCFKNLKSAQNMMRVHMCMNYLCNKKWKQLYLKSEVLALKIVVIILDRCGFFFTKHTFIGLKSINYLMKTPLIRRVRKRLKMKNHVAITSDSPSSTLGVREMVRTEMQPCKETHLSFSIFFLIKWRQLLKALWPLLCYIILV